MTVMQKQCCWIVAYAIFLATLPDTTARDDGLDLLKKMVDKNLLLRSKFHSMKVRMREHRQVSLKLSMSLRHVIDLHENKQVLTSSVSMGYYWRDTAYTWDPRKHNGTEQISVQSELIWIPDILMYNNVDPKIKPMMRALMLNIKYTGDIVYRYPAIFRSACAVEMSMYPFDQQRCTLMFASWAHNINTLDIDMTTSVPTTDVHSYSSNARWLLVKMSAERIEPIYNVSGQLEKFPAVVFSVVLRRRWVTLCLYLLYPNAVTNLLAMMIHLLPCDSTEKVTMGVFLFLTTVFYLKLLEAHLPAPGSIPLIVEHVLYTIIMSCLSQTIIIVVLHLHHNVKTPIPVWVRRVFLYYLSRVLRMNWVIRIEKDDVKVVARQTSLSSSCSSKISQKTTATARDVAGDDGYFEGGDLGERSPGHLLVGTLTGQTFFMGKDITEIIILKIDKCLQDFDDRTKRRLEEKVIRNEWKQVAMVIDRCMFYIYMFATCYLWMLFYNNTIVYTDPGIE